MESSNPHLHSSDLKRNQLSNFSRLIYGLTISIANPVGVGDMLVNHKETLI